MIHFSYLEPGLPSGQPNTDKRVDQRVVQFEGLVHNEGDEVQQTVIGGAARNLGNLGLDHRVCVVSDALITQVQALYH